MAKTAVEIFKDGRNVKYLREAWIWGFRCAQEGKGEEPPSSDEIWKWFSDIGIPTVCSPETNADDDCVVLTNNMKEMTLDEKPVEKKKPGRPKKVKKKKAKKAKNPKLSKPLLRELLQELELVGEDDKSDLKSLQEVYKEHYNSLLDEKGFVDEEKEGEFQLLQEKMTEAEEQWAAKQLEKKAMKEKKKSESDDSSNESDEELVVMKNPLVAAAPVEAFGEPVDADIPAPHSESIEAKRRKAAVEEVEAEKKEKPKKEKKKEKKANKHKWKGGVKELREFLTEKGVEFGEKDRKPVLAELYEKYMDCEERKAEAEAENAPEMLKNEEQVAEVEKIQEIAKSKPVDVGNPLAESPGDEEKVMAAKQIQHHWKMMERLEKDVSDDIEIELPKDDECGYVPLEYEGVSYQVDRETQDVLNMEGTKVGELENGIVIFEYPYDNLHAAKASAEVSDDSGDETEDMSSDEENDE